MNELIQKLFKDFTVDGVKIPVVFLFYNGEENVYVVYQQIDADSSYSGDDELLGYVEYYDFDVYSKGNYLKIIDSVKKILTDNGFVFQPSRTSSDMYETDTKFYHKTLNFAIYKEENVNG